ncbi:uncharacterized protein KY384_001671 [Bacidia gigantensis]|uniref:uncharacterized protein n=1 Tax=Bacidia gigantensis TaxID=2732470 RepID=UPI001D045AFD|nr:uncharacterized protein KY384_001671 [Bacidia gigantensis]KAG8533930.1 hypothetical protein KY384_001671 [Bacidia gigantensis]
MADTVLEAGRPPEKLVGYPTFADFIARDKDAAIYRKFESLSARNLLYQQSELQELEGQLENLDREDSKNIDDQEARQAAVSWEHFAKNTNVRARKRRGLQSKIRMKLKQYHEALLRENQVLALSTPRKRVLRDFRRSFKPGNIPSLWGRDEQLFDDERDLVALAPIDTDRLNLFLKSYFGFLFKERDIRTKPNADGLYYFPERRVQYAGLVITTILSAILLIGAIVCLLYTSEKSLGLCVGMLVLFTCLFAAVVGLLTNAKRAEIFMSTAAYAAVLVVFIGNINVTQGTYHDG